METTLIPFATLPACAQSCGPLYDANGACVPPAAPTAAASVYGSCFCSDARVAPFSTDSTVVCPQACTADPAGFGSIQAWFTSFCGNLDELATAVTTGSGTSSTGGSRSSSGGGGDWLSTHWQWVVMLVVMVVGIAGIWVGACIWRRRYLRKKDRQYSLGKNLASTTRSGANPYGGNGSSSNTAVHSQRSVHQPQPGMFMPAPISSANVYDTEKPKKPKEKKKWVVKERT